MKIYLAARFSRLPELLGYKQRLAELGRQQGIELHVNSRWLLGGHDWVGTPDEEIPVDANERFAREDLDDILDAGLIVCFTEPAKTGPSRGGRHVEMGYAYGVGKPILIVGHRENVYCCLSDIAFVPTFAEAEVFILTFAEANQTVEEAFREVGS